MHAIDQGLIISVLSVSARSLASLGSPSTRPAADLLISLANVAYVLASNSDYDSKRKALLSITSPEVGIPKAVAFVALSALPQIVEHTTGSKVAGIATIGLSSLLYTSLATVDIGLGGGG